MDHVINDIDPASSFSHFRPAVQVRPLIAIANRFSATLHALLPDTLVHLLTTFSTPYGILPILIPMYGMTLVNGKLYLPTQSKSRLNIIFFKSLDDHQSCIMAAF